MMAMRELSREERQHGDTHDSRADGGVASPEGVAPGRGRGRRRWGWGWRRWGRLWDRCRGRGNLRGWGRRAGAGCRGDLVVGLLEPENCGAEEAQMKNVENLRLQERRFLLSFILLLIFS